MTQKENEMKFSTQEEFINAELVSASQNLAKILK
jgi:hypothetical protein